MPSQSPDPRPIIERKHLPDGSELQLKRWTSDFIQPGRTGYQLALVSHNGGLTTQHPIDWENYSESQIREMYSSVKSARDFDELRKRVK